MKKILLFFSLLSVSYLSVAQNTNVTTRLPINHNAEGGASNDNSGFGIKGGVNFNQVRGGDKSKLLNASGSTAWHAGIYAQFPVAKSNFFSIQPEALYNRQGFESDSLDVKMDFIQVPLLFVFNVLDNVSVHVGPYASVLVTLKEDDKEVGEAEKDMLNSFAYGACLGAEARWSIARFGARYNLGLNDIYSDPKTINQQVISDLKTGSFQVYVGVGFK